MSENYKKFLAEMVQNKLLQKRIQEMKGLSKEQCIEKTIELAAQAGFVLKKEDFDTREGGLAEEELSAVAGGSFRLFPENRRDKNKPVIE